MASSGILESIGSALLMCSVLLILASPMVYSGWKNRNRVQELSSIDSTVEDSNIGDYILVSGEIKSTSSTIRSPFQSKSGCIAMWDISTLKRRGTLGAGFVWSQEALGIEAKDLILETNEKEVNIKNLSNQKVLDSTEKVKRSLMADSTSKFSSIELELDHESFDKKVRPTNDAPVNYNEFTQKLRFQRPRIDSFGIIGDILTRLRTPSKTTRYRESVFQTGDNLTLIGRKTEDGVKFEDSESMSPLVSSKSISRILRKYRISYLFQLYFIPIFCISFSGILGYGAYV